MVGKEVWMWLASGLGFGAVNSGELIDAYPEGAAAIAEDLGSDRLDEILTQKQAEKLASTRPADFALPIAHGETMGVITLPYDDPQYPDMLRSIPNPPMVLFVKGDTTLMNGQLSIGMVGARRPSAYGVEVAKAMGRGIALGGAIIVSGLAAGLDAEAHKAALAVNGPTVACIAFGHDHCYPAANKKLMEVIERYGAVVSEYPIGTSPEKPYFLHRNRIIAGLSHGLVVVEARRQSGTMSTVNFASEYGRDVFGVPGSVFSELSGGTNAMIAEGAYVAANASNVMEIYGISLGEEDPVKAAIAQASKGKPQAAPAAEQPAWQRSLSRHTGRTKSEVVEEHPPAPNWGQTLAEALQGELGNKEGARVSGPQAIDAFKRMQQDYTPRSVKQDDASLALEDRVAAVSDSVEIFSRFNGRVELTDDGKAVTVSPFPWNKVEQISKKDIDENGKAIPPAVKPKKAAKPSPGLDIKKMEPIGRVEAVKPVSPVGPVAAVSPVEKAAGLQPAELPEKNSGVRGSKNKTTIQEQDKREERVYIDDLPPQPAFDAEKAVARLASTVAPAHNRPAGGRKNTIRNGGKGTGPSIEEELSAAFSNSLTGKLRTVNKVEPDGSVVKQSLANTYKPPGKEEPKQVPKEPLLENYAARPPKPDEQELARAQELLEWKSAGDKDFDTKEAASSLGAEGKGFPKVDLAKYLDDEPEEEGPLAGLSDSAKRAFAQLGAKPISLSKICELSGLSSGETMAALTELELAGLSRQLAGRQFVIMQ